MSCEALERDLDPYIDRELAPAAATAVRDHLSTCMRCRERVAEREALGRLVRSVPYRSAPDRLRARVVARASRPAWTRTVVTWAAAAAVVVAAVGGGLTLVRSSSTGAAVVDQAIDDHVRSLMADHLFDVESTDQHTVKPWFLGKLDFAPPVVDLATAGFPLVGGRLDYLGGRPVAALVYRRNRHTINLFVAPAGRAGAAAGDGSTVRGFHVFHWVADGMAFWAVSDLNQAELSDFVRRLQQP